MKYLKVDNEADAKRKSIDAIEARWPNRQADQLALHLQNPRKYPHPSELTPYLVPWVKDLDTGECELRIPDGDDALFSASDRASMKAQAALELVEGNDRRVLRPKK